jgi:predicted nucleotidyltransferase
MAKKRYAAVICEYNPFHYGHLKQIEYLKNEFDGVICIMSGNLVQRGEIAVADKYSRAKAAVMCGASLVVSLPFPYCMMSARDFAAAGVYIAAMLGADALAFGCEDDFALLEKIYKETNNIPFEQELEELIKKEKNLSYPKAKETLVAVKLGEKAAEIIRKPNNILTLEYLAAIEKGGYRLKPHPVTRDLTLRSSSSIRAEKNRSNFLSQLPECSAAVYGGLSEEELPRSAENLSQYIIGTLRRYKVCDNKYTERRRIWPTVSFTLQICLIHLRF